MMTHEEIVRKVRRDLKDADPYKEELDTIRQGWISVYDAKTLGNESKNKNKSKYISRDVKRSSEWQRSQLVDPFVSSPRPVKTYPVTPDDAAIADQDKDLLNYQFSRGFPRYNFISESIKILQREGTALARISWKFEETEVEVDEPVKAMLPDGRQIQIGSQKVMRTRTLINRPWAEPIDNQDIWIDPTAKTSVQNAKFVIHRYRRNLSELKSDGRYTNLDKVEKRVANKDNSYDMYSDDFSYDRESNKRSFFFSDNERKELEVYEYWGFLDINQDGITEPVVITVIEDILIYVDKNPFPDGFLPFVSCAFNAAPFNVTGEANAETLKDGQILKSGVIRGAVDNMVQSTNGQVGIKKQALDPINKRKFERGENFLFNTNPNDIWQGSYNQLPPSLFDFYNLVSNEMEASSGVKSFSQGIGGSSMGTSATATRGILGATEIRELDIVRNIRENYIIPMLRMWMAMNREFLEPEDIMRITGKEFVPWNEDDSLGEIDIDLEISTASMDMQKSERIAFLLQTTAQFLPQDLVLEMTAKMYELDRMPDLAERIRTYQPQPDPYAEEMKQLEMEKLKSEIEERRSRSVENESDRQLKMAKAAEAAAKAGKTTSEQDKLDQDFLDKETGFERQKELDDMNIKHKQEIEKKKIEGTFKAAEAAANRREKAKTQGKQ
jgi:hypothetical protein